MPLDLLIIMLGTNDFKNRISVLAMDIARSISRLVKAARDSSSRFLGDAPEVLVICPPPLADMSQSPFKDILIGAEEKSRQLASTLGAFCEENEIRMFDAGTVVQSNPVDGIHWELEEHRKLAIELANEVLAII